MEWKRGVILPGFQVEEKVSLTTQKIAAQTTVWVYYLVCRLNRGSCHIIAFMCRISSDGSPKPWGYEVAVFLSSLYSVINLNTSI